ncbi:phosphonate ABC transporter phosphate-binding protein [Gracilibacillus halophilus YIM-C55.5]|uniref:Phosphonate ABC transporter phosphate-binding protein n=1 Tax=Gracilibacillus halophilus YIM-C55.5 TaxID=1308866 RepID=N4WQW6_9BACI|nr:phosphate/phosphite/phosphonate ABC transporter substrate-binding protein [Gracilibacillus halophilus]ENH95591.1 phosphonate ABC transporter phosphate-binding protein [Gracilibacillus halophilus YIM-C55.5]
MKKIVTFSLIVLCAVWVVGCSEGGSASSGDTLTFTWLPNESGEDLKSAREEIGNIVEEVTGKEVEHETTTDYIVAIESLANGNADLAFLGAQGYVEAHEKNENVLPIAVASGPSGTLEDAVYHSWLNVKKGNETDYKEGEEFTINNIEGQSFSFVSNSSTSGFKVPSEGIVSYFNEIEGHEDLTQEDLLEGGTFFSEVMFGGSHQGSAVNLLSDKAEVAAFCDTCVDNYVEHVDGEENKSGAVYRVSDDAVEPFHTVTGEEFVLISVTPVLNAPFTMNTETLSEEDQEAIVEAFTSEEVANNESIFIPEDAEESGLFSKTDDERFLEVEDSWFDPIRELSN